MACTSVLDFDWKILYLPCYLRFIFEFVVTNEQNVAQEVRSEYVDTMRKIYLSHFKSYSSRLAKLRYEEAATKDDLMGIEDMGASRGTGLFYKTPLKHNIPYLQLATVEMC